MKAETRHFAFRLPKASKRQKRKKKVHVHAHMHMQSELICIPPDTPTLNPKPLNPKPDGCRPARLRRPVAPHGRRACIRSLPGLGVRIRGTLWAIDPFKRPLLREPEVGFRRVPFKGSP